MTGLWHLGFRPGQRFLWLKRLPPGDATRPSLLRRLARLSYVNVEQDPRAVVEQYRAQRPDLVYGQLSALVMLCEGIDSGNRPGPSLVVGFGEQLMPGSRKLVKAKLGADLSEIYGTTEAGLVAVRRPDATCYEVARPDLLLEFLPAEDAPGFERLIVTTLGGGFMPFIRYDTGDLAQPDHT
jgi:phenylacetate-coenzyme A ligase PaaK-like adenylate-forming protein